MGMGWGCATGIWAVRQVSVTFLQCQRRVALVGFARVHAQIASVQGVAGVHAQTASVQGVFG
jgi:hypothetical protein